MVQKVIFTKTADRTFNEIATFIEKTFLFQMFYRIVGRTLIVSNFFDSRQHPGKSRF